MESRWAMSGGMCRPTGLEPQELVLTMLGAHMLGSSDAIWSGGLVRLLGELGFSQQAARSALARLALRRILVRHRRGRLVDYTVSGDAQRSLSRTDRRMRGFGRGRHAADVWTMVVPTLPDDRRAQRSRLASGLRFLGLGPVQHALWLGAGDREADVRVLLGDLDMCGLAAVSVGRLRPASSAARFSRAWDLASVARRYGQFLMQYEPPGVARRCLGLGAREAFVVHMRAMHAVRTFCSLDPELPDAMSPLESLRARTVATVDALGVAVRPRAREYFDEVTRRGDLAAARLAARRAR